LKKINYIFLLSFIFFAACSGSKKYFKAAERLEKQGLVNDAANYYLESLQRKPTFVDARIKLKSVGQKHISSLASDFFRSVNTQQLETSLSTFENLQDFYSKAAALNVNLDYPKTYDEDYKKAVETYCHKNYDLAYQLIHEKKYNESLVYIGKVKKYNTAYKNIQQLDVEATCEPLYQRAISHLENKNYSNALLNLNEIKLKTEQYKDAIDLTALASAKLNKSYILFEPKYSNDRTEREIEEFLYNNFNQAGLNTNNNLKLLNNTPFQNAQANLDLYNSVNLDLLQAIRKASGADYYYVFDVGNPKEYNSGLNKSISKAFKEIKTRVNDSTVVTEYKPVDYNVVKSQRSFAFDFKYKIINANTGQIVGTQQQNIRSVDAIEYNEFLRPYDGNLNNLFPYNPQKTSAAAQFNPRNWRNLFSARNTLKSMVDLRNDTYNQSISMFKNSVNVMK